MYMEYIAIRYSDGHNSLVADKLIRELEQSCSDYSLDICKRK